MRGLLALALTMLPALGAADAVVTVATQNRQALVVGKPATFIVSIENRGTSASAPVTVSVAVPPDVEVTRSSCAGLRCSFGSLDPGRTFAIFGFEAIPHRALGPVTLEVTADGAENPHFFVTLPVFVDPALSPSIEAPDRADAQNRATVRYVVSNAGDRDWPARLQIDDISTLKRVAVDADGWNCPEQDAVIVCETESVPAHGSLAVAVTYQLPSDTGFLNASAQVTPHPPMEDFVFPEVAASSTLLFSRWFRVTSAADAGAGTLRQVIGDLDAQCDAIPCGIEFALDVPRIAPLSPLPPVRAWFATIKGNVFLDGSDAGDADGLSIEALGADVEGLAIGRFARNGLLLPSTAFFPRTTIAHNSFGVDLDGAPAPNGLRGLRADHFAGDIVANVMSDNVRSGMFLVGVAETSIRDNRFAGNGASGMFLGGTLFRVDVEGNTFESNAQFGIALENGSDLTMGPNVIRDNGLQAIDIGLDGPTPTGVVIDRVHFDAAANETVIAGTLTAPSLPFGFYDRVDVYLYATPSPRADAGRFLGVAHALDAHNFTLRIAGPLPEGYVTAASVTTEALLDLGPRTFISEISEPVPVQ